MARRCGCGSTCACSVVDGAGMTVTGTGSAEDPLTIINDLAAAPPTITGSRGGNAALASLLTALANAGVIVNNTTA